MSTARIAILATDPPGLTFFDSFDPDSYTVIAAINDALVYVDEAGQVCPGLATAWHQRTPTILELELREGVRFHNGEPFPRAISAASAPRSTPRRVCSRSSRSTSSRSGST